MRYAEKIKHAEKAAEDLLAEKPIDEVRQRLQEEGLPDKDIDSIIVSARNIIGEKLKPIIRSKLLSKESIGDSVEFEKLDSETLKRYITQEIKGIGVSEKRKVNELLKKGTSPEDILKEIRQDFYPKELIVQQIAAYKEVKRQNSVGGRLINIIVGAGLVIVGGGISILSMQSGTGAIFYGMVFVGLIMLVRGFIKNESPYD